LNSCHRIRVCPCQASSINIAVNVTYAGTVTVLTGDDSAKQVAA
jgi:hypothetical protein